MSTSPISIQQWHAELKTRRSAYWRIAQRHDCDALLVFGASGHAEPFRYLTHFVPVLGDAYAVQTSEIAVACVLNFAWQLTEARAASAIEDWTGAFDPVPEVIELLADARPRRVGVIGLHRLPVTVFDRLRTALPACTFDDLTEQAAVLRRTKSDLELQALRAAAHITDLAFGAILPHLRQGVAEHELAAQLTYEIQRHGAELSFPPTVISGNDDPVMIRLPGERQLQGGDSVMIDIGAAVDGYQADATRTYILGEPNPDQLRAWATIERTYAAVLAEVRPGISCRRLHEISLAMIEEAGYTMLHRIGHGIGLATSFEWPALDTEHSLLTPGMTLCIEPGVYSHGAGSMKLEDDLVVTVDGYELLTHAARRPTVP